MSADGELIAPGLAARGELLPPAADDSGSRGRSIFEDFASRLRPYVAPPPPAELGWQAVTGAGMTLLAAALLALLPSGQTVAGSGVLHWIGRESLASTVESAGSFAGPLAVLGLIVLTGIAVVYWQQIGTEAALLFLTAQTWLGVLVLGGAGLVCLYALVVLVLNVLAWVVVGIILLGCAIVAMRILAAFA